MATPVTSPPTNYTDDERMAKQAPYLELDDQVRALAATEPSPLAGTRLDVAGGRLFVYWVGEPAASLIALRRSAHESGITIVVEGAPYSERQLKDAAGALAAFAESQKLQLTIEVHTEGTGLTVRAKGLKSSATGQIVPTPQQSQILAAINTVRGRTGIPFEVADADEQLTPVPAANP